MKMNNSDVHAYYLYKLHEDKVNELLPVIIIIALLMVIGFVGNVCALLFYWRQARRSSTTIFIITLTVTDLLVCFAMSFGIADLVNTYVFENEVACILYIYLNHVTSFSSGLTLVIIAVDRYRKLCQPLKKQVTLKNAKIIAGFNMFLALMISLPVFFLYGITETEIHNTYNASFPITGSDCSSKHNNETVQIIVHIIYICLFGTGTIILIVLYSLIGRVIYRYHKNDQNFKKDLNKANAQDQISTSSVGRSSDCGVSNAQDLAAAQNTNTWAEDLEHNTKIRSSNSAACDTEENIVETSLSVKTISFGDSRISNSQDHSSSSSMNDSGKTLRKNGQTGTVSNDTKPSKRKAIKKYKKTVAAMKMTIMLFIIAVIYVASFLPYHSVTILDHQGNIDTWETVGMQLALRSYILNSIVNPFVYGLFNAEFRRCFVCALRTAYRRCYVCLTCGTK